MSVNLAILKGITDVLNSKWCKKGYYFHLAFDSDYMSAVICQETIGHKIRNRFKITISDMDFIIIPIYNDAILNSCIPRFNINHPESLDNVMNAVKVELTAND